MVRRSLRAGLWLGLLVGLAWSLRRMLMLRRAAGRDEVSRHVWTPLPPPREEPSAPSPNVTTTPDAALAGAAVAPKVKPAKAAKTAKATKPATPARAKVWAAAPDGVCPPGHPVKAKTSSRIFRVPGMSGYDETRPDRCYRSEDDALADGFTRAKR